MRQKGRKSVASLTVIETGLPVRPSPPDELNVAEKELFTRITATKSVDFFDDVSVLLLSEFCRLKTSADLIADQIAKYDPEWLKTDDGVARYKSLSDMRDKTQGRMIALARSMRLTNQSRYPPGTAATRSGARQSNEHLCP